VAGAFECGNEPLGYIKIRGISSLAEHRLAFQEGLCSMELVHLAWYSEEWQDIVNCIRQCTVWHRKRRRIS
jgi:hypothetical protein